MKIAIVAGDGIGTEIMAEALKVLDALSIDGVTCTEALAGAAAWREYGHPLPDLTITTMKDCDAVLFGAVGDPECDHLERHLRPEQAVLGMRRELELFANLRPAKMIAGLEEHSALRAEVASQIDLMIVRELNGDVYFGDKGMRTTENGLREGFDIMSYNEDEVRRIAAVACETAMKRNKKLCSVDKANVLETSQLWRDVVTEVAAGYPDITLEHMYVDNAAMQLVRAPGRFDTIVTGNLFGDILSDQASMCVGSIGLLASASLGASRNQWGVKGAYEPIHGTAPDIAGKGLANPVAMVLSLAMMLRYSFGRDAEAERVERAVAQTIEDGILGGDLGGNAGTAQLGDAICERL